MAAKRTARIVVEVLRLGTTFSGYPSHLGYDLDGIFQSVVMPHYLRPEINVIQKELEVNNVSRVLENHNYDFPYLTVLLDSVCEFESSKREVIDFLSYAVLYSYLSFTVFFGVETKLPDVKPLLRALKWATRSSQARLAEDCAADVVECLLACDSREMLADVVVLYLDLFAAAPDIETIVRVIEKLVSDSLFEMCDELKKVVFGLTTTLQHVPELLQGNQVTVFVKPLVPFISRFDPVAIDFLLAVARPLPNQLAEMLLPRFCETLLTEIVSDDEIVLPKCENEVVRVSLSSVPMGEFGFSKDEPILDGFDPSQTMSFPQNVDLGKYVNGQLQTHIRMLTSLLDRNGRDENQHTGKRHIEMVLDSLFEIPGPNNDPVVVVGGIILALWMLNEINRGHKDGIYLEKEVALRFYHPVIFDPRLTVFDDSVDMTMLNTLRSLSLEYILSDDGNAICEILDGEILTTPYLLAELLERLVVVDEFFAAKVASCPSIITSLQDIALKYKTLSLNNSGDMKPIKQVRMSMFSVLAHLLADHSTALLFFKQELFVNAWVSFVFEGPVRAMILQTIRTYLMNVNESGLGELPNLFYDVVLVAKNKLPDEQALQLLNDILEVLSTILAFKTSFAPRFHGMCDLLYAIVTLLGNDQTSQEVYEKTIVVLAMISQRLEMTGVQVDGLTSTLMSFKTGSLLNRIFPKLVQLLAGGILPSLNPCFLVGQPQVMKLLLTVFVDTPKFDSILDFIISLVSYSPLNLEVCASCDIDIILLSFIEKAKETEDMPMETVKKLLMLYSVLASERTTAQSILRFISLLAPIGKGTVSKYEEQFFMSFDNIILDALKQPQSFFELNGGKIEHGVQYFERMKDGFSFAFWLYLEEQPARYHPAILTLECNDILIRVSLSNGSLLCAQDDGTIESSAKLCENLQNHRWYFFVLSYKLGQLRNVVNLVQDCKENEITSLPVITKEVDLTHVKITLGGGDVSTEQFLPSKLAWCGLYPLLSAENQIGLFELGLRPPSEPTCECFQYFVNYNKCRQARFVDVLVEEIGILAFLPSFTLRNHKMRDGTPFQLQIDLPLSILSHLLTFSIQGEQKFFQRKGFNVLSQILMDHWGDRYNVKIYQQLVSIMHVIREQDLQEQLFDSILTHYRLLILADNDSHVRILHHWGHSLLTSFHAIANRVFPRDEILAALRIFYWYTPSETLVVYGTKVRKPDLNVSACRKQLMSILFDYYSEGFSEKDFECLISHCISCTDMQQVEDLIDLLVKVFEQIPKNITFNLETRTFVFFLQYFLKYPFSRPVRMLQIMFSCLANQLISREFFFVQIEAFSSMLTKVSQELFDFIRNSSNDVRCHLVPLEVSVVIHQGSAAIDEFVRNLVPSHDYVVHNFWAVWFFLLTTKCTPQQTDTVLAFLIQCDPDNVEKLYAQIDLVFQQFSCFKESLSRRLISAIINYQWDSNLSIPLSSLAELCKRVIFWDDAPKSLVETLTDNIWKRCTLEPECFSPGMVFQSITSEPQYRMSFHVDDSHNWMHVDLAIVFLETFLLKGDKTKFLELDIILCAFLQRTDFGGVEGHLKRLNVKETDVPGDLLALLNYHTRVSGRKPYFQVKEFTSPLMNQARFANFKSWVFPTHYFEMVHSQFPKLWNYCSEIGNTCDFLREADITTFMTQSTLHLRNFVERENLMIECCSKSWRRLWDAVSIQRAPWHNPADTVIQWKRDKSACFGLVPVKLCRLTQVTNLLTDVAFTESSPLIDTYKCKIVSARKTSQCEFRFHASILCLSIADERTFTFSISAIKLVFKRGDHGLQLFTDMGPAFLIEFDTKSKRDSALQRISSKAKNVQIYDPQHVTDSRYYKGWIEGRISNYEYIMFLNHISGRSFNDLNHYPVAPWILKDYSGDTIDFNDPSIFRDLSLPVVSDSKNPVSRAEVIKYLHDIEPFTSICKVEDVSPAFSIDDFVQLSTDEFTCEVIPEFFAMPEAVSNPNFAIPLWSKSPLDFVYNHRKLLESRPVSENLHKWITLMWGTSKHYDLETLFTETHPPREIRDKTKKFQVPIDKNLGVSQPHAVSITATCLNVEITFLASRNCVLTYSFRPNPIIFNKKQITAMLEGAGNPDSVPMTALPGMLNSLTLHRRRRLPSSPVLGIQALEPFLQLSNTKKVVEAFAEIAFVRKYQASTFVVAQRDSSELKLIDPDEQHSRAIETKLSKISCLETDGHWIVVGGEAWLVVFRELKRIHGIQVYRDSVSACSISESFGVIVAGTNDGSIIVCSCASGTMVRTMELGKMIPKKICVSRSWGFIVSYCQEIVCGNVKHHILVHTINGDLVKRLEIPSLISCWYTWSSYDGVDYLVMASESGKLDFCEIYEMNIQKNVYWCQSPVLDMCYSNDLSALVVATASGHVHFVPFVY